MKNFVICLSIGLLATPIVPVFGQAVIANYSKQTEHLAIAREGTVIWLAASKAGVLKCDLTGNVLEKYTTANGLTGNTIYDILIDQQGRRWYATDGGISVLNTDNNWTQYPYIVKSFTQATNGDIWAAGKNIYLLEASTGNWTILTFNWYTYYDRVVKIGPDNTVYVGGAAGLAVRNPISLVWTYYNTYVYDWDMGYIYRPVQDIEFDTQGKLWVIQNYGLFTFADSVFSPVIGTLVDNLPNNPVAYPLSLEKLPNGNLLIGTTNGLWIYDGTSTLKEFKSRPGFRAVYDFVVESNNKFWFSSDLGFSQFEDADFEHYTPGNQMLASGDVFKILIDEADKKWFFGKGGRSVLGDNLWDTPQPYNYNAPIWAVDASFEPDGTKWFWSRGNSEMHLARLRNDSITLFPSTLGDFGYYTQLGWDALKKRTIFKSNMNNKFWYCENDSLRQFEIPDSDFGCWHPNWQCMGGNGNEDEIRHFFISAEGYYFWANPRGYYFSHWGQSNGIANDTIVYSCGEDFLYPECPSWDDYCACNNNNFVAFDSVGNTWLASDLGIRVQPPNFQNLGNLLYYFATFNSELPNDSVQCIVFDPLGNAWIGTRNGLAILDLNLNWTILNTSNSNLAGNYIHSIVFDTDGSAWVGTETGASHLSSTTGTTEGAITPDAYRIFPNPAASGSSLTVEMDLKRAGKVNFGLMDATGKTVRTFSFSEKTIGNQIFNLKMAGVPAGVYFLKIETAGQVFSQKIILQN